MQRLYYYCLFVYFIHLKYYIMKSVHPDSMGIDSDCSELEQLVSARIRENSHVKSRRSRKKQKRKSQVERNKQYLSNLPMLKKAKVLVKKSEGMKKARQDHKYKRSYEQARNCSMCVESSVQSSSSNSQCHSKSVSDGCEKNIKKYHSI